LLDYEERNVVPGVRRLVRLEGVAKTLLGLELRLEIDELEDLEELRREDLETRLEGLEMRLESRTEFGLADRLDERLDKELDRDRLLAGELD